jgi:hypothetical protein
MSSCRVAFKLKLRESQSIGPGGPGQTAPNSSEHRWHVTPLPFYRPAQLTFPVPLAILPIDYHDMIPHLSIEVDPGPVEERSTFF